AFSRRVALTDVQIDDAASILFEFASGGLGYLGTSWVHANRTAVIALYGTEAQAWSEADGARLFLARRGASERTEVSLTPVDAVVEEPPAWRSAAGRASSPARGSALSARARVVEALLA